MSSNNTAQVASLPSLARADGRVVARFTAECWTRRAVYEATITARGTGYHVVVRGRTHAIEANGATFATNVEAGEHMRAYFKRLCAGRVTRIALGH